MSDKDPKPKGKAPRDYEVGRGKPPPNQFPPGKSGNPKGRPRGSKNKVTKQLLEEGLRSDEAILRIGNLQVSVQKKDGTSEEMSLFEATMKTLGSLGLKGSRVAIKDFVRNYRAAESRSLETHMDLLQQTLDLKQDHAELVELRRRRSKSVIEPLPHPDQFIVNWETGEVAIEGPKTPEEKAEYDRVADAQLDAVAGDDQGSLDVKKMHFTKPCTSYAIVTLMLRRVAGEVGRALAKERSVQVTKNDVDEMTPEQGRAMFAEEIRKAVEKLDNEEALPVAGSPPI